MMQLAQDPLAILIASLLLAGVFARGSWHKLSQLDMFRATFEAYELLPARIVHWLAPVLGGLEALIALCLLVPVLRSFAAVCALVLLVAYAAAIAINLRRGRFDIDCGCGGTGEGLSWLLVGRNMGLMLLAVVVMFPAADRELGLRDMAVVFLALASLGMLLMALEQTGANNAARRRMINVFQRGA